MSDSRQLQSVSDADLLRRLHALMAQSRRTEADLVRHVGEVDARRLFAREACPSMFAYCVERLHLSEHAAYLRITAARAARRHPEIQPVVAAGGQLGPDRVAPATFVSAPKPPSIRPLAPERHKVQFTASSELRAKLERLQQLQPGADLAAVIEAAVTEQLKRLEARRFARVDKPRKSPQDVPSTPKSRYIPAPVRRAVHERDQGRCTYRDRNGRRCTATGNVEFHHHALPYGMGGDHSVGTIRLMCPMHNRHLAESDYGAEAMTKARAKVRPAETRPG